LPVFHVEMRWRCAACHTENLGRHKRCQHCSKGKDTELFYDAPDTANPTPAQAVVDPQLIAAATAGADWVCGYCGDTQPQRVTECANCGASKNDPAHPAALLASFVPPVAPEPGVDLAVVAAQAEERATQRRARSLRNWTLGIAAAITVTLLSAFVLWLIFRTRELEAKVVQRSWEHTVIVERNQIVAGQGFAEDRPSDAFDVVPAGERHHHSDRVQDGTERESYSVDVACGEDCETTSVTCTANDNGFKTCSGGDRECRTRYCSETRYRDVPRYKSVPVYRPWYTWRAWQWVVHRKLVEKGATDEPRFATAAQIRLGAGCGPGEQERERRETKYEVVFADEDGERYPYPVSGIEEFSALTLGAARKVRVGRLSEAEIVTEE
jgi:hypothetical protein